MSDIKSRDKILLDYLNREISLVTGYSENVDSMYYPNIRRDIPENIRLIALNEIKELMFPELVSIKVKPSTPACTDSYLARILRGKKDTICKRD